MTKTLRQAVLQLFSGVAAMFLPIPPENQPALVRDHEGDPITENALSRATCELYHHYGMYLAPLTAVLTTLKHSQFGHQSSDTTIPSDGGELMGAVSHRVTDPGTDAKISPHEKVLKKVAAGHAGAAARKTKQDRLLEEPRAAKESL